MKTTLNSRIHSENCRLIDGIADSNYKHAESTIDELHSNSSQVSDVQTFCLGFLCYHTLSTEHSLPCSLLIYLSQYFTIYTRSRINLVTLSGLHEFHCFVVACIALSLLVQCPYLPYQLDPLRLIILASICC